MVEVTAGQFRARLDELRRLNAGWLDGEGSPLNPAALAELGELFELYYPADLPLPYMFPTVSGGIQLEWRFRGELAEVVWAEVEIDLASLIGDWSDDWLSAEETAFDLRSAGGWGELAGRIRPLSRPHHQW